VALSTGVDREQVFQARAAEENLPIALSHAWQGRRAAGDSTRVFAGWLLGLDVGSNPTWRPEPDAGRTGPPLEIASMTASSL
jgi:hypothetical protein